MAVSLFAPNNQPLTNILDADGLVPAQIERLIPLLTPRYQRPVLSKIVDTLGSGATQKIDNIKFTIYRQPNDYQSATIQTRTASGLQLVLALTGDGINAIQQGSIVVSESGALAEVVVSDSGSITISFFQNPNGNTAFVAADFALGEQATSIGTIGDIYNRNVSNNPFSLPTPYVNYIGQWDDACEITFQDANTKTWVNTSMGKFYALAKESQTLQQMMVKYNRYMLSDVAASGNGNKPVGASVINQIKTMGGLSVPLSSQLTLASFRDTVRQYISRGGFTGTEVVVICGAQYLGDIQTSAIDYLLTAGTNNTIGGNSVKGINVFEYGFNGLNFKFIVDPFLDNIKAWGANSTTGFSNRSRSAVWMSTDKVQTENGGLLPFVCDYYQGSPDVVRQIVNGMTDLNGEYVKVGSNGKKAATINYTLNKCTQLMNPAACLTHGF